MHSKREKASAAAATLSLLHPRVRPYEAQLSRLSKEWTYPDAMHLMLVSHGSNAVGEDMGRGHFLSQG